MRLDYLGQWFLKPAHWTTRVSAAVRTKFSGDRALDIASGEAFRGTLGKRKAVLWNRHEHVGGATRQILALSTVTLSLHDGITC